MFGILRFIGVDVTIIFITFALLVVFPIQVLLCFKEKKLWLRLSPIIVSVVATLAFIVMYFMGDTLIWAFFAVYGVGSIITCIVGWLTWFVTKKDFTLSSKHS